MGPASSHAAPPRKPQIALWPLVFTLFIGFVFLDPYQRHAGALEWTVTTAAVFAFFALCAYAVSAGARGQTMRSLVAFAVITLIGLLMAPFNAGAALFIIYATAFAPYGVAGRISASAAVIGTILAAVALESWLLHLSIYFWGYSFAYALILGTGGVYSARAAFAAERMAKADERERIARDLHDVLGHTLSVVVLKAELARRLLDRDPEQARAEMGDVERIAREALAEVRQAISGYLAGGLQTEVERARQTLAAAGVPLESRVADVSLTPAQERVLALVLREAVTNVVRHAQAKKCRVSLQEDNKTCRLEVEDDGRGGAHAEGNGLRGMRERVEALGGSMTCHGDAGTRLTILVPAPDRGAVEAR